ncbi:MAG TPA: hypothetical protein VN673_17465, partial [Clostridia bacterium]|nr:hypothetical protein [Clostridia bacterium]
LFRTANPFLGHNSQRGYFAGVAPASTNLVLGFTDGTEWHPITTKPLGKPLSAECELGVTVRGDRIVVAIDGQAAAEVQDSTFRYGSVGLRVADAHTAFTSLEITPLSGEP